MPEQNASRGTVLVMGMMFFYPLAGVSYQFLHYMLGLRKLGYDAYYVEDTLADVYDATLNDYTSDASRNIAAVSRVLERFGFAERWAYHRPDGGWAGMDAAGAQALFRRADACLNVTGAHALRDEHRRIPRRLYVESDPFATQVRIAKGDPRTTAFLDAHTHFFTFGENLGEPDCGVPIQRYRWMPTRQPVDLDLWAPDPGSADSGGRVYTTVTTWHNKGEGLEWNGERYWWTKDREFRKYLDLPLRRPSLHFELATNPDDQTRDLLHQNGWRVASAAGLSSDPDSYRSYIQSSRAEFTVARDQYTRPRTGWFSDRSVCYLASGRPVVTQETGFSKTVRASSGLFGYSTMPELLAAVDAIESDYPGNCRAALDVAAAYFDNRLVLASLLSRAGM